MSKNPLKAGYSREVIGINVARMTHEGYPQAQAVAAALDSARRAFEKRHPGKPLPAHIGAIEAATSRGRRKNPVPETKRTQTKKAATLYTDFTGHDASERIYVDKPEIPDVLLCVGEIDFIGYTTVRDGVIERYKHDFKKKARPLFCVTPDGQQIVLLGGAYDFTERGIIDRVK